MTSKKPAKSASPRARVNDPATAVKPSTDRDVDAVDVDEGSVADPGVGDGSQTDPIASSADVRSVDGADDRPVLIRSEGQRMLRAVTDSLSTVGKAVGASKQAVHKWRDGQSTPDDTYRRELQRRYQIPVGAWAGLANGDVPDKEDDDDEDASASVTEDLDRLLRVLRVQLKRKDLTPRERVQLTDGFTRAVLQKAKFEKDRELLEDRTIREHPKWQRLKNGIIDAVLPFPEAARAVEAVIIRFLGEEENEANGLDT